MMSPAEAAGVRFKRACRHLSDDELKSCFTRFSAGAPEGKVFDLFRAAYDSMLDTEIY
jgi:hypothetical protein